MDLVSVVLISKNQEWNIARLVESVLEETQASPSREIVLVDSDSTDDTVDIACDYPIGVIRLQPDQRLTAAAGRYVGYQHTSGELVLFLDGDMELYPGWLEQATHIIRNRSDVAGITGQVIDLPREVMGSHRGSRESRPCSTYVREMLFAGGAAMYRRSVLKQVGTFRPYVYSDEEPELCLRIRQAGYRILSLDHPIAYHYSDPIEAMSTLVAQWRRNLYLGSGQNIRYNFGTSLLWPYVRERGYGCVPGLALAAGLLSFAYGLTQHHWRWFKLYVTLTATVILIDALRKRSLYRTMYSLVGRLLTIDGTIRGFLLKPLEPDTCLLKFVVVKALNGG